ncbi:hypothetical protein Tco_0826639 [Tanacetum coccineum]
MRDLISLTVNLLEASQVNSQQSLIFERNKLGIRLNIIISSSTSRPGQGSLCQAHVKFSPGGERGLRGLIVVENTGEEARAIGFLSQTRQFGSVSKRKRRGNDAIKAEVDVNFEKVVF